MMRRLADVAGSGCCYSGQGFGTGWELDLDPVRVLFYFEAVAVSEVEGMLIEGKAPA
jgi:hypothetical protein